MKRSLLICAFGAMPFFAYGQTGVQSGVGEIPGSPKLPVDLLGRVDTRVITLRVPAPRGMILDAWGKVLTQNRVAYALQLRLPFKANEDEATRKARLRPFVFEKFAQAELFFKKPISLSFPKLEQHFKHRRWLPFSTGLVIEEKEKNAAVKALNIQGNAEGWVLIPVYLREYPHGSLAAHVIGTVQKKGSLSRGQIVTYFSGKEKNLDPQTEETEGRDGLEKLYDDRLRGQDGLIEVCVDANGVELSRWMVRSPVAGKNIVTSIDLDMQIQAELLLAKKKKNRSAFVVLDLKSGDIPVLASYPSFNPADFVPSMSNEEYRKLTQDPSKALYPRAWKGLYPPGSIFKVVSALAALEKNVFDLDWSSNLSLPFHSYVREKTVLECGTTFDVDGHRFTNKRHEGPISVYEALMVSCNTWFYPVGIQTGGEAILQMAGRLGLGDSSGLETLGELANGLPLQKAYTHGDEANLSIGQGKLLVSPVQAARMSAALVQGGRARKFHLVRGSQLGDGPLPTLKRAPLSETPPVDRAWIDVVKSGMYLGVNRASGTGSAAAHPAMFVSGKTGTAQWGALKQRKTVVWFTGFVPYYRPRYAFAVMVEGNSQQELSGGSSAAPIVGDFLRKVFPRGIPDVDVDEKVNEEGYSEPLPSEIFPEREASSEAQFSDPEKVPEDSTSEQGGSELDASEEASSPRGATRPSFLERTKKLR